MNILPFPASVLALRIRSKTKGLGDIPNKQKRGYFSGQENGLLFCLCIYTGSACDKGTVPGGECASSDRHRAVRLELITPYPANCLLLLISDHKNKKTAIDPGKGSTTVSVLILLISVLSALIVTESRK